MKNINNNMFKSIFSFVNSIFTKPKYLYREIYHEDLPKYMYLKYGINLDKCINTIISNRFYLYVFIQNIDNDIHDIILCGNYPVCISVIPNLNELNNKQKSKIIYSIYSNIFEYISGFYKFKNIQTLIKYGKKLLPMLTLINELKNEKYIYKLTDLYEYINEEKCNIDESILEEILSNDIESLFDYGGLFEII